MAAETDDVSGAWKAVTTVTFAVGTESRRVSSGKTGRPTKLNPLVSYPDASAVAIKVSVANDDSRGTTTEWDIKLHPDVSGCQTIGLTVSLEARTGTETSDVWDEAWHTVVPEAVYMPGKVAGASAHKPLEMKCCCDIGPTSRLFRRQVITTVRGISDDSVFMSSRPKKCGWSISRPIWQRHQRRK